MPIDSLFNTIRVSGTGTKAQRVRMDVIASNLANLNTTRTPDGGPYARKVAIFGEIMRDETFKDEVDPRTGIQNGVAVMGVVPAENPFKEIHDPGHPDADENGMVTVPNINPIEEMVNLVDASRAFEANMSVIRNTRQIINDTIRMLRS